MRDSLVIYRSTIEAVKTLPGTQRLKFYESIFEYALNDNESQNLKGVLKTFFELTKPLIDSNNKKYLNGCKGGRPTNNSDTSPLVQFEFAEDVNLTENQFAKLKDKYNKQLLNFAIEEVQDWLNEGKSGNPNYKKAQEALGRNHYGYFNRTGWAITNANKRFKEQQQQNQPNWSC